MSRTIRRKTSHLKSWSVPCVDRVDAWDLERYGAHTPEQCVQRASARFHSDAGTACSFAGVPTAFRRELNKKVDRANKTEIARCRTNDCWDDFLAHPHVSNAAWLWW